MHSVEKAFVRLKDGVPFTEASLNVWLGLSNRGYEVVGFTDLTEVLPHLTPETLVHSGVGDVRRAVQHLGFPDPNFSTVPWPLLSRLGRRVWLTPIGEVRKMVDLPLFVKPLNEHKAFKGCVVRGAAELIQSAHLPDATSVVVSDPVEFVSEFRGFVHWDELIGFQHYRGNPLVFPDPQYVREAVALMSTRYTPVGYSLDFGVLADGRTTVVEANDGFSLGAYGLAWWVYVPMVLDRWLEMTTHPVEWVHHLLRRFIRYEMTEQQFSTRFKSAAWKAFFGRGFTDDGSALYQSYQLWLRRADFEHEELRRRVAAAVGPMGFAW
jgi:hypothetical protein